MSRGLNKIQLIGNLGRDPEMRFTPSGSQVTEFSLAVSRRRRGQDGENIDETDWFRIVCWNRLAEIADQYLTKGTKIYVEGRLQVRRYTGNDGQERTSVDVVASEMLILTPRGERDTSFRDSDPGEPSDFGNDRNDRNDADDLPF